MEIDYVLHGVYWAPTAVRTDGKFVVFAARAAGVDIPVGTVPLASLVGVPGRQSQSPGRLVGTDTAVML